MANVSIYARSAWVLTDNQFPDEHTRWRRIRRVVLDNYFELAALHYYSYLTKDYFERENIDRKKQRWRRRLEKI